MLNLSVLNPQQREAVETLRGPVLILAGAGTGKTRVITYRIAHLIAKGVAPGNILAVTFTNKAAREMQERIRKLIPAPRKPAADGRSASEQRPTICTFHSLCVRILRRHIEKLGYKSNFVIYDESEQLSVIKKILSQISAKGEKADPAQVLSMLSRFKNGGERAAIFADDSVRALARHIRARYESALHACNAVDFDDLILLTLRLFAGHPDALESCRAQYRYVMADEYQDTNAAQFQLIHALAANHRNFCVVGDDDQSIYGWRGAEIGNLLDLEKHFPEVKIIKLEQNYRSTNTILNAANAIIKNNPRRRPKQLWSGKGQGNKITLRSFTSDEDEARSVVEQIEFARMAHRAPWADNAILFRTNLQSRPLETALRKAGVRYHLIGGQSFFDRREVKDFIAYVKTFLHPHDDISLLRIANVPARGLSDVTMERLLAASHERKSSVFTAMKSPVVQTTFQNRTRESIEKFVEFIERTAAQLQQNAASPKPLQSWSESFLDEVGYFAELRRGEKDADAAENRIRNLREMIATLDNFGQIGEPPAARLQSFLEDVTLDAERLEEKEEAGDAVTLITMHSCKGLEFPRVYIVGLEEGLLPHSRSAAEGTLDEERRLFYVAVTRAMQSLAISHCAGRRKYGQLTPCHPSRFLKELPPELVEDPEANKIPANGETAKKMFDLMRNLAGGDAEALKS
ncbi:MAG TPA: UvrD-helicase domain-containing protein [Alphaproteobacteria bacterium]|nr:UvrD-helicase domain-containing protein [Alphaproteobacteria bacterium]